MSERGYMEGDLFRGEGLLNLPGGSSCLPSGGNKRRTTELLEVEEDAEYRRAYGVTQLMTLMADFDASGTKTYHILTGGQVDLTSYVWFMIIRFKRLRRVLISSMTMNGNDLLLFERWRELDKIGRLDVMVSELFKSRFGVEYAKLEAMQCGGLVDEVYCSGQHCNFVLAETDGGRKLVIETSANCSTNRSTEFGIVSVSDRLYDFYDRYFMEYQDLEMIRKTNAALPHAEIWDGTED